jgi:hypothetical protein
MPVASKPHRCGTPRSHAGHASRLPSKKPPACGRIHFKSTREGACWCARGRARSPGPGAAAPFPEQNPNFLQTTPCKKSTLFCKNPPHRRPADFFSFAESDFVWPHTTLQKTESAVMIHTVFHPRRSAARTPRSRTNPRATAFSPISYLRSPISCAKRRSPLQAFSN